MTIKITSKLTASEYQRLRRRAWQSLDGDVSPVAFQQRVGAGEYAPLHDTNVHAVAWRMMVVAGRTFAYEVAK